MADDYAGNTSTTGAIAPGGSVTGELEVAGDSDWFKFTAVVGEAITFDLITDAFPDKFIQIYSNNFTILASSSNGRLTYGVGIGPTTPVGTTYEFYVAVKGFTAAGSAASGAYTLTATSVPDDAGDDFSTTSTIVVDGAAVTAASEYNGDVDWFRFDAVSGVPLELKFTELMAGGSSFKIYDQFGRTFAGINVTPASYQTFTPDSTGTYYLALTGYPSAVGGTTFALKTVVDDWPDDLSTTGVFAVNGPAIQGKTHYDLDLDVFALDVAEAGIVRIESGPFLPYGLSLYDAAGNEIDFEVVDSIWDGDPLSGGITARFDAPGRYYVGVTGLTRPTDVDPIYSLRAYSVTDDIGDTIATAAVMAVDGPRFNGAIEYNADFDVIGFAANAGDAIRIDIQSPGFFLFSETYDANGGRLLVQTRPGNNNAEENGNVLHVTTTGMYYLVVEGDQGDYSIGLTTLSDDYDVVNRGSLTVGGSATGVYEDHFANSVFYGDIDSFAVTVAAGQTIAFSVDAPFSAELLIDPAADSTPFIYDRSSPHDNLMIHTFRDAGVYYFTLNMSREPGAAYTVHATEVSDDFADNDLGAGVLQVDGAAVAGVLTYRADRDWFAVTVDAGDVVEFAINVGNPVDLTGFSVLNPVTFGATFLSAGHAVRFDQAGTYYLEVVARDGLNTAYTVSAVSVVDDLSNTIATTASLTVGGATSAGHFEYRGDRDWFAVNLEAGKEYQFTITSSNPVVASTSNLGFFDGTGAPIAAFPGEQVTSRVFTPTTTGTYYLEASSTFPGDAGEYAIGVTLVPQDPLDSINTGMPSNLTNVYGHIHRSAANVVKVYFSPAGEDLGGVASVGWTAADITRVMTLLESFEAYINIDFQVTTALPLADIAITAIHDPDSLAYYSRANEALPIPTIAFSTNAPSWTSASLAPGGFGAAVVLNGLGYVLGLNFPHGGDDGTRLMSGVTTPADLGDFTLNQGINTIMSFNDGWATSPFGVSPDIIYGWQATPMALDIAALQSLYGANTTHNAGDNTYFLTDVNAGGAAWRAIWDVGGSDAISYQGARNAVIDLRSAPLAYVEGGGGFVSYVDGIFGGFTVASGVTLESAVGGSGNDRLIGNAGSNLLSGNGGNDILQGGLGDDTLDGDSGIDTASYSDTSSGVTVSLALSGAQNTLSAGLDTLTNIENLVGSAWNDTLTGDGFANTLDGGSGSDVLTGGAGADVLIGGLGGDVIDGGAGTDAAAFAFSLASAEIVAWQGAVWVGGTLADGLDRLTSIEELQFSDQTISASSAPSFEVLNYVAGYNDLIGAYGVGNLDGAVEHFIRFGFTEGRDTVHFDGWQYLAGYNDLIVNIGADPETAARHFIQFGVSGGRERDTFNGADYIASHNDLIAAFGLDEDRAARHFVQFGHAAGRERDTFDGWQYIASYDDLIGAIGADEAAAARHFVRNGYNEGRSRDVYNWLEYIAGYDDLIVAYGADETAGARHFVESGFVGGRERDAFDGLQYIASHGDLIRAFGEDEGRGASHFIQFGYNEGRARDTFDAAQYVANYADLQAAFGDDLYNATRHYILFGYAEGRTDADLTPIGGDDAPAFADKGDGFHVSPVEFGPGDINKAGDPGPTVLPGDMDFGALRLAMDDGFLVQGAGETPADLRAKGIVMPPEWAVLGA